MKMKFDLVAVGGTTEDQFFSVDDYMLINNKQDLLRKKILGFEYGSKIGITGINTAFGGGAANVSVSASRLGMKTAIIGAIGSDARGKAISANLKQHGVDIHGLDTVSKTASGLSYILISPSNEHIVFTYRGVNSELRVSTSALKIVKQSTWTYVTSLTGNWQKTLKAVFAAANLIVWNPGRQQLAAGYKKLKTFLARTDVLICNRDEALELVMSQGKISRAQDDSRYLLRALKSFGPKFVIITNGGHGAEAFDGEDYYFQKAITVRRVIDTTGVGDAFGSTFIAGLELYQGNIKKSLALAAKNAARVVVTQGAQPGLLTLKRTR